MKCPLCSSLYGFSIPQVTHLAYPSPFAALRLTYSLVNFHSFFLRVLMEGFFVFIYREHHLVIFVSVDNSHRPNWKENEFNRRVIVTFVCVFLANPAYISVFVEVADVGCYFHTSSPTSPPEARIQNPIPDKIAPQCVPVIA